MGDLNDDLLPDTPCHLKNMIDSFKLYQFIDEPTRITATTQTLLDPVITNNINFVEKAGVIPPFCSDHHGTFAELNFKVPHAIAYTRRVWQYDEGNYEEIRQLFTEADWNGMITDNVEQSVKNVTNFIYDTCKQLIPNKLVKIRPNDPSWMTSSIKNKIRKRNRVHSIAKRSNSPFYWAKFRKRRNEVIQEVRKAKKDFLISTANKLRDGNISTKQWWSIIKSLTKSHTDNYAIPVMQDADGNQATSSADKANVLNEFFTSQSYLNDGNIPVPEFPNLSSNTLTELHLQTSEVKKVLQKLKPNKSHGPDSISPRVLKECADQLATPLCTLFNLSLCNGIFPEHWKKAMVTAIYKKGNKHIPSNYRPISLLSCIGKTMEKCVFIHLYNFLTENKLITPLQSGFTPGDSTVYQLIDIYDTICSAMDDGKEVRAVFCDIQKAFDRVWHKGLIKKLCGYGIRDQLLNWFSNYLSGRSQCVVVQGSQTQSGFVNR